MERAEKEAPGSSSPGEDVSHAQVLDSEQGRALLYGEDHAPQRTTVYWVIMVVLLAGAFMVESSPFLSGQFVHEVLEAVGTSLAVVIGALALVRFYSKKRSTFLFIGTGFLGTAFLDGYHAVITSSLFPGQFERDLSAWSWIASRVFLSLMLYAS